MAPLLSLCKPGVYSLRHTHTNIQYLTLQGVLICFRPYEYPFGTYKTDGIAHVNPSLPSKTDPDSGSKQRQSVSYPLKTPVLNIKPSSDQTLTPTSQQKSRTSVLFFFPTQGVYPMSVSEDKVPGEEVGRLKAKDPDLGDNGLVNYRLIDGDGMAMFELSTDSETREAVIKLKKVRNERLRLKNQHHQ